MSHRQLSSRETTSADPLDRYRDALETLPSLTRAVLLLRACDELSHREIAWRLGIAVDEVTARLADSLVLLDRFLDRYG